MTKVLLFWDEVAWVATTVEGDWYMTQGKTQRDALGNLARDIGSYAEIIEGERKANRKYKPVQVEPEYAEKFRTAPIEREVKLYGKLLAIREIPKT